MGAENATQVLHPAYPMLREAAHTERRQLARALAIEVDWRYHDGPEWAARYWEAFADLAVRAAGDAQAETRRQLAARSAWRPLDNVQSDQARAIFRALLAAMHPDIVGQAQARYRTPTLLWPQVLRAYCGGELDALTALLHEARARGAAHCLPEHVVALRAEHDRLRGLREAADRRLAELSQQFPFSLRDKLADADWIRRQRLAWRQALIMASPPPVRHAAAEHKRVS